MKWEPISKTALLQIINDSWGRMTIPQRRFWKVVNISPVKWKQQPYGKEGKGFWVIAIIGNTVVWYNDIEDGFNRSNYSTLGIIDQYRCNQDELEWQIQHLIHEIKNGQLEGGYLGEPQSITEQDDGNQPSEA